MSAEFDIKAEVTKELDKYDQIRNIEREIIAKFVERRAFEVGDKAEGEANMDDALNYQAAAFMLLALAGEIRKLGKVKNGN